jgi:hypothetical protein
VRRFSASNTVPDCTSGDDPAILGPHMEMTTEQHIYRHKSFMHANWEILAAFAWGHYQKDGRGMVVVLEDEFIHAATPQMKAFRFDYAAKDSGLLRQIDADLTPKEWGWLDTYDPDQRVIVIIVCKAGLSTYLIGGPTKPSEAFIKEKAKYN